MVEEDEEVVDEEVLRTNGRRDRHPTTASRCHAAPPLLVGTSNSRRCLWGH